MWLVVNDIIIGVFFAYILRSNADAIADFMRARVQVRTAIKRACTYKSAK